MVNSDIYLSVKHARVSCSDASLQTLIPDILLDSDVEESKTSYMTEARFDEADWLRVRTKSTVCVGDPTFIRPLFVGYVLQSLFLVCTCDQWLISPSNRSSSTVKMDSDNDSGNSNDGPIHRRRTQGTRPPASSHSHNSMQRISSGAAVDRAYHPTKEDPSYSDDEEVDEDEDDEDDDEHQRRHHQQANYRGRGRPSQQQQHLMDSSYDDGDGHHDLPRYTGPLREQDRFLPIANVAKIMKKGVPEKGKIAKDAKETIQE